MESESSQSKRRRPNLSEGEKTIIYNVYCGLRERNENMLHNDVVNLCSDLTEVSIRSVHRILKSFKENEGKCDVSKNIETRGRKQIQLDDCTKYAIRRKFHLFFFRNEIPTLKKVAAEISSDETMPKISRRVLLRTLKQMNIKFIKRGRKSALIEREEIVLWRRNYLKKIREYRLDGRKIYYLDETFLNQGHTVSKGSEALAGKGRRLLITHIGSDSGFLENGLLILDSNKTSDYHEEMFESWFSQILPSLEPNSVVVMDNASYHSRQLEQSPTTDWPKADIINWLSQKNLTFDDNMLKVQLLNIARKHIPLLMKYVVDEMARERNIIVHRLPPYHCELNPTELIWAQIKNQVAREDLTSETDKIKGLLATAIENVTPESWKKCIRHTIKEEDKMWDLDTRMDIAIEPLVISSDNSDCDSCSSSNEFSSEDNE
ncbi:uncharacterized protein isoform X1 [Leptinotarsa decemlineata]|uniref:uncharacterized protein isoform X1 n=2 Tax=Leptinotarsa decemlineata TaxID=7539 RepID=UPI003D305E5D